MNLEIVDQLRTAVQSLSTKHHIGRVVTVGTTQVSVSGLGGQAALGDPVEVLSQSGTIPGEVIQLAGTQTHILLDGPTDGTRLNDAVILQARRRFAPHASWIGRVIDPDGQPLDGKDVIVIALVGERGREVRHFVENVLGPEGMRRAVIVAATSDRAAQVRKRCALAAMAIAEHFRDAGRHVLLFVDSVTRFRAGPGTRETGDITAVLSVLVAGSDMDEPVADMLRGVLDGHVVLDREIAERGRFPAVDVLRSVSRSLPDAANDLENSAIAEARMQLGRYANAELMIQAGLYTHGTDKLIDSAIDCHEPIDQFLRTRDSRGTDAHFMALRQALAAAH